MEEGVKYRQRQKLWKNDTKGKMVILHQNGRSHFLNPWWILSLKDQTLKFWWFWDSFDGVWHENMQEDHFGRSSFLTVLTFKGYFGKYKKFVCFLKKAIFGKIVADFQRFKMSLRTPITDFVWPSKHSQQVII